MEIGDKIKIVDNMGRLHAEFRLDGYRARMRAEQKPVFTEQGYVVVLTNAPLEEVEIDLTASGIEGYRGTHRDNCFVRSPLLVRVVDWMNTPMAKVGTYRRDFFAQ